MRLAREVGDLVGEARAGKLLTFLDRLVLHAPRSTRGGKQRKGLGQLVTSRLRLAWRGDWAALWREAAAAGQSAPVRAGRAPTSEEDARAIHGLVRDGLLGKALSRVMARGAVASGPQVVESLRELFPSAALPMIDGHPPVADDDRERLLEGARQSLDHYPARSGPGPNGARFEHWGTVKADEDAWEEASQMVVRFLLGEVPRDFLCANLGSRLIALRKPNGKVRPIACGSVLRRLAARAACAAFRDQVRTACGPYQYAVGRQAGCEQVHKAVTALSAADPRCVFLAFDASNAFNTLPRGVVLDAVAKRLPGLAVVVNNWLGQPTGHTYWQANGGKGVVVEATAGVDQGCPLSPALFAMGIADTLDNIIARVGALSSAARVFSYLDDVIVAIPSEHAAAAEAACVEELQRAGLVINTSKTAVWTKDPSTPLPESFATKRVSHMKCLGATAPWLHRDDALSQLPVHDSADGDAAVAEAARFRERLAQLRAGGLRDQAAFQLLQTYSAGCVTHLLRANYEQGSWVERLDEVWVGTAGDLAGDVLDETRQKQLFLRLTQGGMGLTSAKETAPLAFLASWAFCLHGVAVTVGAVSWATLSQRCASLAVDIRKAEEHVARLGEGKLTPPDWVACMLEPSSKLQGLWSRKLKDLHREVLLRELPSDDRVDFRSCGGPGAGGFLEAPVARDGEATAVMPNAHFALAFRDRLRLPLCAPGSRCQRRDASGVVCGKELDPRGKHCKLCEFGSARTGRHNSLRDFVARYHYTATGLVTTKEQRVVAWDRMHPRTGQLEEARLDVATRDAATGLSVFVDATVTCAYSGYAPCQRARANKDGLAAAAAVGSKRARYPPSSGDLVPFAFEDGGRPAEETVAFVRSWGHGFSLGERSLRSFGLLGSS